MSKDGAQAALLIGGVGAGLVLLTNRAATPKKVAPTPNIPPIMVPTVPTPTAPSVPVPSTPPVTTARARLIDQCEAAIYAEIPARRLSPQASRTLAVNLVTVCEQLHYPLDLAFGHARAESDLQLLARNASSGAVGPLQVTSVAAQQVGIRWPVESPPQQLEAGLRYMLWLRRAFPECSSSVKTTLQHYGMGRGNWLKYRANGCAGACSSKVSVLRAECGCGNRPYSDLVITTAKKYPQLHTIAWWGGDS